MMSRTCDRRLPAEWEPYDAVLLAWPHAETDWAYMLEEVQSAFIDIVSAVIDAGLQAVIVAPDVEEPLAAMAGLDRSRIVCVPVVTNDTWARDFGVMTCSDANGDNLLLDFKFNGWGLKFAADKDNLITSRMNERGLLSGRYENHLSFVLEGGSIESDGCGTILTTRECLLSPNRNGGMTKDEIETYIKKAFGAERVLWIDHGYLAGDDTDSHVDTLARLVAPDTIVYVKCDDENDEHYEALSAMERELMAMTTPDVAPYHLVGLPLPHPVFDEDGNRLPATYANFLITPHAVLLPVYGQPDKDLLAEQMMKIVYPDRRIVTVNCQSLIKQHGSLHCMTMQLPFTINKK